MKTRYSGFRLLGAAVVIRALGLSLWLSIAAAGVGHAHDFGENMSVAGEEGEGDDGGRRDCVSA